MEAAITMDIQDNNLIEFFNGLDMRVSKKPILATLRKGATEVKKELRSGLPSNLKKFKAIISSKTARSMQIPSIAVGFYGRKVYFVNKRGVKWDAYMIVYWANYGTLSNRDGGHTFKKGRRSVSSKWKGGLNAQRFVENSMDRSIPKAETKIIDEFGNIIDKWAQKNGFR